MITIKTGAYSKDDLKATYEYLNKARDELASKCDLCCDICPHKIACEDLTLACNFITKRCIENGIIIL